MKDHVEIGRLTGFRQNTDPLLTPLLTPYKINGKMKIKKSPELSMGPDSSSSINLPQNASTI